MAALRGWTAASDDGRVRRLLPLIVLASLAAPASALAAGDAVVPGRVVVGFEDGASAADRAAAREAAGASLVRTLGDAREQLVRVPGGARTAAAELARRDGVAYAEPDFVVRAQWTPNDPGLADQWSLAATAAQPAWDGARGQGALVGVADTGADFAHPDLGRFASNSHEVPGNGLDDDGNGRVDDVRGWDFVNGDGDASDDQGHGTSVTGVIAASAGNGQGIAGVAPEASVVEAKVLGADGSGSTSVVAAGMRYLADRGARVVNLSLGGPRSYAMASVLADEPQTLFVVAAGNEGVDNDGASASYPCADPAPNVLCVGASTAAEAKASFSNWGATTVDLMAPGASLLTTRPGGAYARMSGTSFAAPMVAGAAALVFGRRPQATAAEVKATLLSTVDPVAAYGPVTVTGGRLNLQRAVAATQASGPVPAPTPAPTPAATPAPEPDASAPQAPSTPEAPVPAPVSQPTAPVSSGPVARPQPKPAITPVSRRRVATCASVSRKRSAKARRRARSRCLAAARRRAAVKARSHR